MPTPPALLIRWMEAPELPIPWDVRISIPPVRKAWARRVEGFNLWVLWDKGGESTIAMMVTRTPPVPIDE